MQLDMLHQNLRPELQKLVRRADFRDIEELQEIARAVEATTNGEKLSWPPPSPDFSMLSDAAYKAKTMKPAKPKLSGVETREQDGVDQKTSPDQPILAAISRLEARLNEIRNQQNSRRSGNNPKRKGNYHQDKG